MAKPDVHYCRAGQIVCDFSPDAAHKRRERYRIANYREAVTCKECLAGSEECDG
jgi:hypothetical protein